MRLFNKQNNCMKKLFNVALFFSLILISCKWPDYVGKYNGENCNMINRVEIHPDETMDIQFHGMDFSINRPLQIHENIIRVLNPETKNMEFEFKYENNTLTEISGTDYLCKLNRDTL
jgi:hypothetical protein